MCIRDRRRSFNLSSNCSIVTPSAPAAPPFLFTFNHASHTRCLGMSCVLPCNFGSLMRFLPHRLITLVHLDDPAPSLPSPLRYAGGSQLLRASPPARPASVLSPSRIPPLGVLPLACPPTRYPWVRTPRYRDAPSHVPDESLDQAHACLLYTSPSPRDRTRSR